MVLVYKLDIGALLRRGVVGYLLVGVLCVGHHILARGTVVWVGTCRKMCGENPLWYGVCIVYEETRSWCTYMSLRSCCGMVYPLSSTRKRIKSLCSITVQFESVAFIFF
jgi:hypothetical protein